MANLTTERDTPERAHMAQVISKLDESVAEGSLLLPAGTVAFRDAITGKVTNVATNNRALGRVTRTTLSGAVYDASLRCTIQPGWFKYDGPAVTIADNEKRCKFTDNHTWAFDVDGDCTVVIDENGVAWVGVGVRNLIAGKDAPDDT